MKKCLLDPFAQSLILSFNIARERIRRISNLDIVSVPVPSALGISQSRKNFKRSSSRETILREFSYFPRLSLFLPRELCAEMFNVLACCTRERTSKPFASFSHLCRDFSEIDLPLNARLNARSLEGWAPVHRRDITDERK